MNNDPLIDAARKVLHKTLLDTILTIDSKETPSIADSSSKSSIWIARNMLNKMGASGQKEKTKGQMAGTNFEHAVADFLSNTFPKLKHLRPGQWEIRDSRSKEPIAISNFEQYKHIALLEKTIKSNPELEAALGADYLITPDIVILREPELEERLNPKQKIASTSIANLAPLRAQNHDKNQHIKLLHASVSCKLTLRSDRAQNARSEALNLIRNRKGRVPHIVAITAEPLPTRIASLALGTSDLDCVYHIALHELKNVLTQATNINLDDQKDMLSTLIMGKRLRDISDLPLDLAI